MILISDKENVLKPFQQNIISEVARDLSVKDSGLLHSACCFSLLHLANPELSIWNKCL